MTMDLSASIVPDSSQINAEDLLAGPATYTIKSVSAGSTEQPFNFMLEETDRAYRPSKTMRRIIVSAWGSEASTYTGRRLTLYREPTILFAGQPVGGIRISALSHIDKRLEIMLQTTRGKREKFVVEPLPDVAKPVANIPENIPPPPDAQIAERIASLRQEWKSAEPDRRAVIQAEVDALQGDTS